MTVRDTIKAGIRTGVQRLVTIGLGALSAYLAMKGFDIDFSGFGIALLGIIDVVSTGAVTSFMNYLEKRFTFLTPYFSLGLAGSPPMYSEPPATPTTIIEPTELQPPGGESQ